ncbi:MAG: peptidase M48 [Acidobacteria bacterium]|nr:MAG: peptidase M48 [Acidobacteriota bacterium]
MTRVPRRIAVAVCLSLLAACATNPATGRRQVMLVSEAQEIEMGREADREVATSIGLYPDEGVQGYVAGLGRALSAGTERPSLPWSFHVVDDAAVNAFALPGGFVYVTRGIMTHLDTEAELASVVGHEIGHVTARHTASQITKSQLATLGLVAGMIVRPELARFGDLAQAGMSLLFLKFDRNAERQADDLGLRYMSRQGYDARRMVEVFSLLDRVGQASGEGRLPAWLSTHPAPEDRAQRIQAAIQAQHLAGTKDDVRGYLRHVDGMVFGDNPREGFFEGTAFFHPDLRFQIAFPRGWKTQNQKQAVGAISPSEDAIVVVTLAPGTSAEQAANEFLRQQGIQPAGAERARIHGLPAVTAVFEAVAGDTPIAGRVAFVEYEGKAYRLLGYTPSQRWSAYDRLFADALGSFTPLTDRRYLDVQPRRVKVVEVTAPMTVEELARRYGATVPASVIALINHAPAGGMLAAGQPAKVVVGGRLPGEVAR